MNKDIRTDLKPEIWGPHGWFLFDSICLSYPNNPTKSDKDQYKNFFYSLPHILPCSTCRNHFKEYIEKYPLNDYILQSKNNLITWILSAHNNVKKINNKNKITLKEFYNFYNKNYKMDVKNETCSKTCGLKHKPLNNNNDFKGLSIILFGIIIALSLIIIRQNQLN